MVMIEVKARNSEKITTALEAVDSKKRKLIVKAANHFLEENNLDYDTRFDVVCVISRSDEDFEIHHIESAFESI